MSLALRKDRCRKVSLSCFFLLRRLLRRASDVDCKTFAIFHLSPGCLASTIAPMVSFVAKPLDFLLSLLTPSCTRIMSTEVLHVKEDHNEFFLISKVIRFNPFNWLTRSKKLSNSFHPLSPQLVSDLRPKILWNNSHLRIQLLSLPSEKTQD